MRSIWAAIRIGLLDMRGDLRRFLLLVVCLAVGTALISGVNSVGASISRAIEDGAAELMGGDIELSRADRFATEAELTTMAGFGQVAALVDTNLRAEANGKEGFVDVAAVGAGYPLLSDVKSPQLPKDVPVSEFLSIHEGQPGAIVDPVLMDQLGIKVGDSFALGGTQFEVRGSLTSLPDAAVRGFRLGMPALISTEGFGVVSDRTSPLPGLATWQRYKILLNDRDADAGFAAITQSFADSGWTIRTARDGLGQMVRYYDLFMRFLLIVGLGSLLIGGVSVWTGMQAYIAERASVIAVLRSIGAGRSRIFIHFFAQVAALAAVGVGVGLIIGGGGAFAVLPTIGAAVGIPLTPALHIQPLVVAAAAGFVTAFAFAYLPLQQAQTIRPVLLFRSKGLSAPPIDWAALFTSLTVLPLIFATFAFFVLAWLMTGDWQLVIAFGLASAIAAVLFKLFIAAVQVVLRRLSEPRIRVLRHALRAISGSGQNAASVVISAGMALAMLIVVLVLQTNLRQEYLGASAFDVPTLVGSDLFPDEIDQLAALATPDSPIAKFDATPMLRGELSQIAGIATASAPTRGPEATFLLGGEVPLTFRENLPSSSRVVDGTWWPEDYEGPALVSLHQSLRSGLGVNLGDTLTFTIFGDEIEAEVASFRDYSWQGGMDFLATFSPGVLENYPTTMFATVTAGDGRDEDVARLLASDFPDVRFIAIGDTLKKITDALSQLSFAATLVGGLAVGNGLLVLVGSLSTGRRQREADTVITKVLGATRTELLASAFLQYLVLALLALIPAIVLGIGVGWLVSLIMLDVQFTINASNLAVVLSIAAVITALLGAMTIFRAASARPARLLRDL
jgi:putative ABC transport system permease protein